MIPLHVCTEKVHKNTKSMDIYRRMYTKPSEIPKSEPGSPLLTKVCPAALWRLGPQKNLPAINLTFCHVRIRRIGAALKLQIAASNPSQKSEG